MGRYSRQFKEEAIKLGTEQGYKVAEAARKLGVPDTTFAKWIEVSGWTRPEAGLSEDPKLLQVHVLAVRMTAHYFQMNGGYKSRSPRRCRASNRACRWTISPTLTLSSKNGCTSSSCLRRW